jgi:hypothetical protein
MRESQAQNVEDKIDLLKHMELIQRDELNQRRELEYKVFAWSSNILLALIGALLITKQSEGVVWLSYGIWGRVVASITIASLVVFSMQWQNKNRKWHQENGSVIQRIDCLLHYYDKGYFDPTGEVTIFPENWRTGYTSTNLKIVERLRSVNYISATALLGLLALIMIWIP